MRCNDGLADHGRWGPAAADSFQPLTCPAFHSWQLTEKPSHTKSLGMGSGVALLLGPPAGPLQLLGGRPLLWPLHPSSTCPRGHGWGFEATPVSSITGSLTGALSCVRLLLPRPPAGRGILTHVLSICCPQSPWGTAAAQCTAGGHTCHQQARQHTAGSRNPTVYTDVNGLQPGQPGPQPRLAGCPP